MFYRYIPDVHNSGVWSLSLAFRVGLDAGEHTLIDKESSPSFDKKCPSVGTDDICTSLYVFETSALIIADLL